MIRPTAALVALVLLAGPGLSQPYEPPPADPPDTQDTLDGFMQGLLDRARPSLERLGRDLGGLAQDVGPVLGEIGDLMDDVKNYQAPERLENGDILIRRRAEAPPPPPIGPNLRDMMRPAPEAPAPDKPAPLLSRDPASEIEL